MLQQREWAKTGLNWFCCCLSCIRFAAAIVRPVLHEYSPMCALSFLVWPRRTFRFLSWMLSKTFSFIVLYGCIATTVVCFTCLFNENSFAQILVTYVRGYLYERKHIYAYFLLSHDLSYKAMYEMRSYTN